jgi:large repetitive protein
MGARFYDPAAGQFLNQDPVTTPAQGDPAAGGDLHAYVNDSPVTGTDPTGHMETAAAGGCGAACLAAVTRAAVPKPAPKSCSWYSLCGASHLYHAAVAKGKAALATVKKVATRTIAAVKKLPVIGRVAAVAISAVSDVYHAGVTYVTRTVLPVLRTAAALGAIAVHVVATAYHQATAAVALVKRVATATVKTVASFVKKHAATIASIAAGVVVFAGCMALTGGVGSIGCGALAGVAASMVTQGAKCYDGQKGACAVSSFAQAAVVGWVTGDLGAGLGEGLGVAASGLAGVASDAVGGFLGRTASDAVTSTENAAAGATAKGASWLSRLFSRAAKACTVGGESFTASTKVLTASGALVAISNLKIGEKVLATSTKTGKTAPGTVSDVLVHHDTNRYNLTVKTAHGTAIIGTTSNHLFWDATARRWVKAAALKYGTHLRTPSGGTATVLGGHAPKDRSGWMWDLTIPGNHDFYIKAATTAILVHNVDCRNALESGFAEPTELHHVLPQQCRSVFARAGLDIDAAAVRLPSSVHQAAHDIGWNSVWGDFFTANPNPSKYDIVKQAGHMMWEFGLDKFSQGVEPYK